MSACQRLTGFFHAMEKWWASGHVWPSFRSGTCLRQSVRETRAPRRRKPVAAALAALMLLGAAGARAATQTLGGDAVEGALKIECGETGMRVYAYLDGIWKQQTFSDDKSSMVHYEQGGTFKYTAGYYQGTAMTCTKNENVSSTVNERIWTGGAVKLTMRTTYVSPSKTENYEFVVENTSGSTLNNVKLFHGQDTYLGYSDAGGGFWNEAQGVVGVQKPSQEDPNRLIYQTLGSASTKPNDYASAGYGTVASLVAQGALNQTINTNYSTDNGYAVQWNLGPLSPGQSVTIHAGETMAVGASLTATLAGGAIGTSLTVTGLVENAGDTTAAGGMRVSVDLAGWTATINGSTNFSLSSGASQNVPITVTCPPVVSVGQVATVTLTATTPDEEAVAEGTFTAAYYDGVALVAGVTDGGPASISENTDFGGRLVGSVVTQQFKVYNGGPSNIALLTNSLVGSPRFTVSGLPAALAVGETQTFEVVYSATDYSTATATLTLVDHRLWSPFAMNLQGYGHVISPDNGPRAGGNSVTITNGALGNGSDVTQVTVGGINADIVDQGTNWVRFTVPAQSSAGLKDVVITSVSGGAKTMRACYRVNPSPWISSVSPNMAEGAGVNVTIKGSDLCNGNLADLTNVTICGIAAANWQVSGTTQLVVRTGAGGSGKGNVVVDSISRGRAISYNSFTYGGAKFGVVFTNTGAAALSGGVPETKSGNDFGYVAAGRAGERIFAITNAGIMPVQISMVATTGPGAAYFTVLQCPTQVAANARQTLRVAFSSDVPVNAEAALLFYNNTSNSPFRLNLLAEAITVNPMEGPWQGGTSVLLSNMTFGSLGTLTGVRFSAMGPITAMGTNWIRFTTPQSTTGWVNGAVCDAIENRSLLNSFKFNPSPTLSSAAPTSGSYTGGYPVIIRGANLCSGADDLEYVKLAGVRAASIVSASPTQVIVIAGAGFGAGRISEIQSRTYGYASRWDMFRYTGASNVYAFSTNAGTASGGNPVTLTYADVGGGVNVTSAYVNGQAVEVTAQGSNGVTFRMPPADWSFMSVTNVSLFTDGHGEVTYSCGSWTNLGYVYRDKAFIGRPDIQSNVWQGVWKNLGFGMLTTRDDIFAMAFGPDGRLYVAGELDLDFSYDSQVAYFENGRWNETGIRATYIQSMIAQDGELYVGGLNLTNYYGQVGARAPILRGAGRDWTPLSYTSVTANIEPWCFALHHDGTNLHAADYHYSYPAEPDVFRYNGSSWTALADNTYTARVYALGTYQGRLYRSGERPWQVNHNSNPVQYWDGSGWPDAGWVNTNDYAYSYSARALSFCEFKGKYYAGQAYFDPYTADSAKMQLMSRDGTSYYPGWTNVPGFLGMANMMNKDNTGTRALCTDGEYLFAAGVQMWHTPAPPGSNYSCVAAFDGTSWSAIGIQGLATNYGEWGNNAWHINTMLKTPRGIYAGGWFNRIGIDSNTWVGATNVAFFEFSLTNGLSPQTGPAAGGTQVTIHGFNLGNGTADDVYRVTLCGVDVASIDSVSSTQIVVTTSAGAGTGDAVVYTYDYGIITQSNVFTYTGGAGLNLHDVTGGPILNGSPAASAAGTRAMLAAGGRLTNSFALVNPGDTTLNVTGVQTNGAGAAAFECVWPSSLAAGQTGTVQVVFRPAASGMFTASVQVANSSAGNNPFVLNLACDAVGLSTNNGPYAGGNTITLTNLAVGTVTNVLVGGAGVSPASSGADWLTLVLPAATSAGAVGMVLQTSDSGSFTLPGAYTYNPAGWINRVVRDNFAIGSADSSWGYQLNTSYRSRHYQHIYTTNELAEAGIQGPATITAIGYNILQAPTNTLPAFLFRMKHTTSNVLTSAFQSNDLVVCYSNAAYAPLAGGFDMLDLASSFEWDGQQNILLDSAFAPVSATASLGRNYTFNAPGGAQQVRYLYSSSDQSYVFTGGTTEPALPQLGVRAIFGTHGVSPSVGVTTGGYEVVISGRDLCANDVTRVTLCGVEAAEIVSASATQVVVRAGAAPGDMSGAVTIHSTSHGISTLANGFRYAGTYSVLGTDGSLIASGSAVSEANGTRFANVGGGAAITNVFVLTNNVGGPVTISSMSFTGAQASAFSVTPTSLTLDGHAVSNFAVVFQPQAGGEAEATLVIESDSGNAEVNASGTAWALSSTIGAEEGGQVVTITNGAQMGFGDITQVIVGGTGVSPLAQGENWVRISMPGHAAGLVDIVVISTILGETTLPSAFTYAPAPAIYGSDYAWEELPGLPQGLRWSRAFVLQDNLYVVGGFAGAWHTNLYRFDGYAWHSDQPGLPEGRMAGAGAVYDGKFYYCGGDGSGSPRTNVYCFNGTNWTETIPMPVRSRYAVAGVVDGKLVVGGGEDFSNPVTNTYLFDGTGWTQAWGFLQARTQQGGAVRRGKLHAYGGYNSGGSATFNQYSFNGSEWTTDAGMPVQIGDMAGAQMNNRNYSLGGYNGSATLASVYRYDGINWEAVSNMPAASRGAAACFWRGAIYVAGGENSTYLTNVWRLTDGGIAPISGYAGGGYEVAIRGTNLCNGTVEDVAFVTICGVTAEVVSASSTQIVVVAGSGESGTGDVVVNSLTYGAVTAENGFTYLRGRITLIGTNGADIAEGSAASAANGTDFGAMPVGQSRTNRFGIRNTGNAPLTLSAIEGAGPGGGSFAATSFPTHELAVGATGQITVVCASHGGNQLGQLLFRDNVPENVYVPDSAGHVASVHNVKSYGSGPGLGLSQTSLTFNATYGGSTPGAQTFTVGNVGADPLTFSNVVEYAGFGETWLTVAPAGRSLNPAASQAVTGSVSLAGLNAGTYTATIGVWSATATNSPQRVRVSLVIAPTTQTLAWTNPGSQTYTNETLLDATATSGLAPTYTLISGPGTLTNISYQAHMTYTSTGIVTVSATQPGNLNFGATASVTQSWEVTRAPGQIWLTNLVQEYDGTAKSVTVLTSPSGLPHTVTYDGNAWAPTNMGTYEVIASIADEFVYGGVTGTLQITKVNQAIVFPAIAAQQTNATVGLAATGGGSGNPVTFAIAGGPGTITGDTNLSFTGVGDVIVVASQAGNDDYFPAPDATNLVRVFSVTPDNGPYAGGNVVAINNGSLGTVTNIVVAQAFLSATNVQQAGLSDVSFPMPPATNAGLTDITLQTEEYGDILLAGAYTYNPAGAIDLVAPNSGSWTGGYEVVITGTNLGDGGDVTNVMLCGVAATQVASQSATQVVVWVGQTLTPGLGDVVVFSTSYGETAASNAFTYTGAGIAISGPAFGPLPLGAAQTNMFAVTNSGTEALHVAAATNNGDGAADFDVSALAGLTVQPGTASNVPVVFIASAVGTFNPACHVANNSPNPNYSFGLTGQVYQATTNVGPYAGGNAVTFTNGHFGTITNVLAGGAVATILGSGDNWFTIVMPSVGAAGAVDVVVQTSDNGYTTLANAYTYNPGGAILDVAPAMGSWTGGYEVVIGGTNLGNGTDVTNATICGVAVDAIVSQSSTQVVVAAGAALAAGTGDVRVFSTSFGQTVKSNAFEYVREAQAALVFAPANPQAENTTNALSVAGGSGTGAVSFAVTGGPGLIVGDTNLVATAGTGTITVVATKAQDDLYFAASATATVAAVYSAEVYLLNLRQIYDGTAKAASATTMPAGLTVQFTYDGSATAPTATGTYEVVGTVNDGEYYATATGTLRILTPWDYQHVNFGDGWCWTDWFGFYAPMGDWTWVGERGYGWLWHEKHGFFYLPDGQLLDETWLFANDMGWLWSGDGIYPFLYRQEDEAWLWYDGGTNPRRFFNFTTELWEERP